MQVVNLEHDGTKFIVTVEGCTFPEITDTEAKKTAGREAAKVLGLCGICDQSGPYPVDDEGNELKDPKKLNEYVKQGKVVKYRNDISFQQSL